MNWLIIYFIIGMLIGCHSFYKDINKYKVGENLGASILLSFIWPATFIIWLLNYATKNK